jgi:hypothetical protein
MCCVGFGYRDDGDYALFSTAVYEHLKKNAPEFEELAAMQAGFAYRPVVVRRGATQESSSPATIFEPLACSLARAGCSPMRTMSRARPPLRL